MSQKYTKYLSRIDFNYYPKTQQEVFNCGVRAGLAALQSCSLAFQESGPSEIDAMVDAIRARLAECK